MSALIGCATPDPRTDDVPTKGHILMMADEDLRSLIEREETVFESIYTKAQLDIRYLPEAELIKAVMNDSVRCWAATVQPGGEQEAYYATRNVKAHVVPICTDAIAVVVNKSAPIDSISLVSLRNALFGTAPGKAEWSDLHGSDQSRTRPLRLLFCQKGSGVARTLLDSLGGSEFAHFRGEAIGTVGAVISDLDDPAHQALRRDVRILPVSGDAGAALLPSQSTLADGSYPLRRPVYLILAEGKSGLGTGFVSFVANHKGQRIILKQGLAPKQVPSREVEIVPQ
jgi:phosphate transport system substrate-binding protein